ncbi:MAG: acyl-CoA synthetase [Gammaproteobacteria bacterium]|nr:MAG: acyl-CoA synthetase [Gammaproteobacteria bacterium]
MIEPLGKGRLERLLRPQSVAVVGGGVWCRRLIEQCRCFGFAGRLHAVHPTRTDIAGVPTVPSVGELPEAPDAVFIGTNRDATIGIVAELSALGAGGAICFASGFLEAEAEDGSSGERQARLLDAAGEMPILGPNCYGVLNCLDGVALWPDEHGAVRTESGVALLMQSSNIAINLTMQRRALPLAYVVTVGNQARIGISDLADTLLDDPRVTAIGLYVEGIDELRAFERVARKACRCGKRIVMLKAGRSPQSQAATVSHTASLAGSDAGADALCARLGVARVDSLSVMLETLKILHLVGPLESHAIGCSSCSGGEASLVADAAIGTDLVFPPLNAGQTRALKETLGSRVALANPLDYHTYIWGDAAAMQGVYRAMADAPLGLSIVVLDLPRSDRCDPRDWDVVIGAIIVAATASATPIALLASLPETLPEDTAARLMSAGVLPLAGINDALQAIDICAALGSAVPSPLPLLVPCAQTDVTVIGDGIVSADEATAKALLADRGLDIPSPVAVEGVDALVRTADTLGYPVVVKGLGHAHKSEAGAVHLDLASDDAVRHAAERIPGESYLLERMIRGSVFELLVGIVRDAAHGFVLTLAAGGTQTELLADRVTRLLPVSAADVRAALGELRLAPVLWGYRGADGADIDAVVDAVLAMQSLVERHRDDIVELEVNPLVCGTDSATAVDALLRVRADALPGLLSNGDTTGVSDT